MEAYNTMRTLNFRAFIQHGDIRPAPSASALMVEYHTVGEVVASVGMQIGAKDLLVVFEN